MRNLLLLVLIGGFTHQAVGQSYKPYAIWWWMGSAVNEAGISKQLQAFKETGIGGCRVIPIYGVKGFEDQEIPYLSKDWLNIFDFTLTEAGKLGIEIDIAQGTGWPFGGPWISRENSAQKYSGGFLASVSGPATVNMQVFDPTEENSEFQAIHAYPADGESMDLKELVNDQGYLQWNVPDGSWRIYRLLSASTGQLVKRAAPGGEGWAMDHFDKHALQGFCSVFDTTLMKVPMNRARALHCDSYEVYGANWTPDFFDKFKIRYGYDLRNHLNVLFDSVQDVKSQRISCDVHEAIGQFLLHDFAEPWSQWCRSKGMISTYQAHGSPGNLLDLYATADIAETESFGNSGFQIPGFRVDPDYEVSRFGRPSLISMKFASSAASFYGKKLVSSESCTWLAEHFKVAFSQIKPQIDEIFMAGINHIFYHGIAYSPESEPWPGWLYYASTDFGPNSNLWQDLPFFNQYVANCQKILQGSKPDNDLLIYFPIHDIWMNKPARSAPFLFEVHNMTWFNETRFGQLSHQLLDQGYTFDFVSDSMIGQLVVREGRLHSPAGSFAALVVPEVQWIKAETLAKLKALSLQGARIIFSGQLPSGISGYADQLHQDNNLNDIILDNNFIMADSVTIVLSETGILPESLTQQDLQFIRKRDTLNRPVYFIANLSAHPVDDYVDLLKINSSVFLYDPMTGRKGIPANVNGRGNRIRLQLKPGQSCFIMPADNKKIQDWIYADEGNLIAEFNTNWDIRFEGCNNPAPSARHLDSLVSWTKFGDDRNLYFNGTGIYTRDFFLPDNTRDEVYYLLDLGEVRETARVFMNGVQVGKAISYPYQIFIEPGILKKGKNKIEIRVRNLSANQIIGMDRQQVNWKKFNDINFVSIQYKPFDASGWDFVSSGLLGPVRLKQIVSP